MCVCVEQINKRAYNPHTYMIDSMTAKKTLSPRCSAAGLLTIPTQAGLSQQPLECYPYTIELLRLRANTQCCLHSCMNRHSCVYVCTHAYMCMCMFVCVLTNTYIRVNIVVSLEV